MNSQEFNQDGFDRMQAVKDDYRVIEYDNTYDMKLYEVAVEGFYQSEKFSCFSKEQQEQIKRWFENAYLAINSPKQPGKFKLPNQLYLDVIKEALNEFTAIHIEGRDTYMSSFKEAFTTAKNELEYVKASDNKFNDKFGNMIWDIYSRPDVSIGVHGTELEDDFDITSENCDFFKNGIMVAEKYKTGDARRTVNFQDLPGKQWSMGYASFLGLMNYSYKSLTHESKFDKPSANYSVLVVRPSSMKQTDYNPERPEELSLVSGPTHVRTNAGKYLSGHLIKPEFILGVVKNNEEFVLNPGFDLEKVAALTPIIEKNNEEKNIAPKMDKETQDVTRGEKTGVLKRISDILRGRRQE